MIFETDKLVVRYGMAAALQGVSLSVREGSCTLIIGPNGAGKSTLLKAASGLVRPAEGRVIYQGNEIQGLRPDEIVRRGLIHCPEGRRLFPDMTVMDNLRLGAYLAKDAADVRNALEKVFEWFPILKERASQRAGTLSGGEQQMLAIGRALMSRPKLLLLDEPSLGLSFKLKQTVFAGIRKIQKSGPTIVLVEQDVFTASRIADYLYILTGGKVIVHGKPDEVLSNKEFISTYLGTSLDYTFTK